MSLLRRYIYEVLSPQYSIGPRNTDPYNIVRWDEPVRTQFWSLGRPIGAKKLQHASCTVIMDPTGKFLGVSRKHNPGDFGFPGGHIEKGETPEQAAVRELEEETGLRCSNLEKLITLNDGKTKVYVFTCTAEGEIDTDESGVVRWVEPNDLVNGSFGDQNRIVLRTLGLNIP